MWRFWALAMALLLSACAHQRPQQIQESLSPIPPLDWSKQLEDKRSVSHWQIRGTLVFKALEAQKPKSGRGQFLLKKQGQASKLVIIGPLGSGTLQLQQTADSAVFILPNNERVEGQATDRLWLQEGGLFWLLGLPDEKAKNLMFDQRGHLRRFNSDDFQIDYEFYEGSCPKRMRIEGEHIWIRIVIEGWEKICTP